MFKTTHFHKKLIPHNAAQTTSSHTNSKSITLQRPAASEQALHPLPHSSSFKSPVQLKYSTRVPAEDKPCIPNKSHSKGHHHHNNSERSHKYDRPIVNTASSQRHLSFKEYNPSAPKVTTQKITKGSIVLTQKNILPSQRSEQYLNMASQHKPPLKTRHSAATFTQQRGSLTSRSINQAPAEAAAALETTQVPISNQVQMRSDKHTPNHANMTMIKKLSTTGKRPSQGSSSGLRQSLIKKHASARFTPT